MYIYCDIILLSYFVISFCINSFNYTLLNTYYYSETITNISIYLQEYRITGIFNININLNENIKKCRDYLCFIISNLRHLSNIYYNIYEIILKLN